MVGTNKVDILIPKNKFTQNNKYNKQLCDRNAELIKLEYDNVQRESSMTDDEIRKNRAAINEELIPGRGYTPVTIRVARHAMNYVREELVKIEKCGCELEDFAAYIYNHGYYTIADEVYARVTVPLKNMARTATIKERFEFVSKSYAEFSKMRDIVGILYNFVDVCCSCSFERKDYHICIPCRIEQIFYEQVFKDINDEICPMILDCMIAYHCDNEPLNIKGIKNILNMYKKVNCYNFDPVEDEHQITMFAHQGIEQDIIRYYNAHYKKEAADRIAVRGYDGYVEWVDTILTDMAVLLNDMNFGVYGKDDMQTNLVIAMVEPYYDDIISDSMYGVYAMMSHADKDGIQQLYSCLKKMQSKADPSFNYAYDHEYTYDGRAIEKMCNEMCRYINDELSRMVAWFNARTEGANNGDETINTIIDEIDRKYDNIIQLCTNNDSLFTTGKNDVVAKYIVA